MSFALISLSSKLKMAGLTSEPYCFCLGENIQDFLPALGIPGHMRVILACENSAISLSKRLCFSNLKNTLGPRA